MVQGRWCCWIPPKRAGPSASGWTASRDFNDQRTFDRCFIEYDGEAEDFPINGRWLFKEEFQLLLRLGGFHRAGKRSAHPTGIRLRFRLRRGHELLDRVLTNDRAILYLR